jgi:hypothetical protein
MFNLVTIDLLWQRYYNIKLLNSTLLFRILLQNTPRQSLPLNTKSPINHVPRLSSLL